MSTALNLTLHRLPNESFKVLKCSSITYLCNCIQWYGNLFCNGNIGKSLFSEVSYFKNFGNGDFASCVPKFCGHIVHIVSIGPKKQMGWAHTWSVVAVMANKFPIRYGAVCQKPRKPMGRDCFRPNSKGPIPALFEFCLTPFPAIFGAGNASPKPTFIRTPFLKICLCGLFKLFAAKLTIHRYLFPHIGILTWV